jgi:hypothetical protein
LTLELDPLSQCTAGYFYVAESVENITVKYAHNLKSARAVSLALCEVERNSYFSAK